MTTKTCRACNTEVPDPLWSTHIAGACPAMRFMDDVAMAQERLVGFVATLDNAGSYDAKRELWLQAIDDSQFENDLRTVFGEPA